MRGHLIHPGASDFDANAESGGHTTHVFEGVRPIKGTGVRQDTGRNSRTRQDTTDVPRLGRNTSLERREHLVGGTLIGTGQVSRNGTGGPSNLGNFEDRDVRIGARDVATGHVEERVEDRGTQPRRIIRHGVTQTQSLAAGIMLGNTLTIPRIGYKRVGLNLDQSPIGQRGRSQSTRLLRDRQTVASGCRRHDHGNVVVAVKACNFLDEVRRQSQVGTPRGSGHGEHAASGPSTAQPTVRSSSAIRSGRAPRRSGARPRRRAAR